MRRSSATYETRIQHPCSHPLSHAGKERNVPLDKRTGRGLKFSDHEVCKYALEGLCPYGLFRNTKSDLGEPDLATPTDVSLLSRPHLCSYA